jgi:hypothetical protein
MRQVVQNYKPRDLKIEEFPAWTVRPGSVLVGSRFSLVSTGTEGTAVRQASMSLIGKAKRDLPYATFFRLCKLGGIR